MSGLRDPTRSAGLRRHGRGIVNRKVFELHRGLREGLQDYDVAGLRTETPAFLAFIETQSNRLARSEMLVAKLIEQALTSPPDWLRVLIARAVQRGVDQVGQELRVAVEELDASEVMEFLANSAAIEIIGIAGETERRVLRQVAHALEGQRSPDALMRDVRGTLEKITKLRLLLLVNTQVVRAVNDGKLFGYRANGIRKVGIDPEWLPTRHFHDRDTRKARVRKRVKSNRERRSAMFAAKQQAKREAAERRLEEALASGEVGILTAGDDKVCEACQDIAEDGPYDLDEARGLIPAHPNCRCAFIPAGDLRFAAIEEQEEREEE